MARLVRDGILISEARGAYRSGLAAPTPETFLLCHVLAAGKGAALTRTSAAHHLGLVTFRPPATQIVIPRRTGVGPRKGYRVHHATDLQPREVVVVRGVPCTIPLRTVVDLASDTRSAADFRILRRALREATFLDKRIPARLDRHLAGRGSFRGSRILAAVLEEHLPESVLLRSGLEADFLEFCRVNGLPAPTTNAMVLGFEIDAWWPDHLVYIELDTYDSHGDARSFERDRARDSALTAAGLRGFRITARRLAQDPATVLAELRALLGQ